MFALQNHKPLPTNYKLKKPQTPNSKPKPKPQTHMTIQEAQQKVDEWINTTGVRYFNELTNMAILTEEVGEVARLMSRMYGEQSFKESDKNKKLDDELADVLWVLLCIANQTGVDLTKALQENFEKKTTRDTNRHKDHLNRDS
jgi:NTP pyrophosphatase (non-canonical NTP hydrolase)